MDEITMTHYYRLPDGRLRSVSYTEGASVPVPDGATVLSTEEYEAALAVVEAQRVERRAEQQAKEQDAARAAYVALALLLPDAVARRLSGYTGGLPGDG